MLFRELAKLDANYIDLGFVQPSKKAKLLGLIASLRPSMPRSLIDLDFSPQVARAVEAQNQALIERMPSAHAVLYWGAQFSPVKCSSKSIPYFLITDGPFDPNDNDYPAEWRPSRWRHEYFRRQQRIYTGARHVFTLSDWARQKLLHVHALREQDVTRIGWGPLHELAKPNFSRAGGDYFISIGNQWFRKGMDVVAAAGAEIHNDFPSYRTIIVGNPTGLTLPASPAVITMPWVVPGTVAQVLISNARALIVASRFDASPHVVFEALQTGTPVIGTEVCGIPEAIRSPLGGATFPRGDKRALVSAIRRILDGDECQQRRNAYQVSVDAGGWRKSAEIVHETISKSLA